MSLIVKPLLAEMIQVLRERTGKDLSSWDGVDDAYPSERVLAKAREMSRAFEETIEDFHAPVLIITVEEYRAQQIIDWLISITREYCRHMDGHDCPEPLRCCKHWIIVVELMMSFHHAIATRESEDGCAHSILATFASTRTQVMIEEFTSSPLFQKFMSTFLRDVLEDGCLLSGESVHLIKLTISKLAHAGASIDDVRTFLGNALKKEKDEDQSVSFEAVRRIVNEMILRFEPSEQSN